MDLRDLESEKWFQGAVIDLADRFGWLRYHVPDSRMTVAGFPDWVFVWPGTDRHPGRVLFVELKKRRGRLSREQQVWLDALRACPGVGTYLWRPSDMPEVIATMTRGRGT